MKTHSITFLFLLIIAVIQGCTGNRTLEVSGNQILFDGKPFKSWGVRLASASQDDECTTLLRSSLDDYKESGINTISVYFQGSNGNYSDPFSSDGKSIDQGHLDRMVNIIKECEKRDMAVIVGIFYQRVMANMDSTRRLSDKEAVVNAVRLVTEKLKPYRNVIINIANEQNSSVYNGCTFYNFNDPDNIIALCREVHAVDPKRLTGGGGYKDEWNIAIGKSPEADILLFDTWGKDIEEDKDSGWKYDYFREQGVPDKPMINVEIFGGWTQKFVPPGVYPEDGQQIHIREIHAAKKRPGLSVHFHSNPWFQGPSIGEMRRFNIGGIGTAEDPGIRWWVNAIKN